MANIKFQGNRVTTNGNQLVAQTEGLIAEAGVFYPITPSTEMGENFQNLYAKGNLNAFGQPLLAIETEGEHAAQGGAIAMSVTGKRTVNFTSGQGIVYGVEQYYHAPGKLSTMVLEVGARALTKHALNVHCGHDDVYAVLDTGWSVCFAKDAQQASDQAIILRKVNELALNPGINAQDGFLTTHLERTFKKPEPELIRTFLGRPDDMIPCPTEAQKTLFGVKRRRVPKGIDLNNPILLGPVQNQEHYMNGVAARRNNFSEHILKFFSEAYKEFGELTGRHYGLISQYGCDDAETVFVALGSAAENIEAAVDYLRSHHDAKVGVIHINVLRPFPEEAIINALKGKKNVLVMERTDEPLSGDNPMTRDIKVALSKAAANAKTRSYSNLPALDPASEMPDVFSFSYGLGSRDFRPEGILGAYEFATGKIARKDGKKASDGIRFAFVGIDHPYAVVSKETPSLLPENSIAVRFHSIGGWGMITTGKNLGEILGAFSNYVAERDHLQEEDGKLKEVIHISANPKYGSEKKGAPTNYFMVAAPERVRVNCDLRHVSTVLCCDPKIFLHTNPLEGLEEGGSFVWESSEEYPEKAWMRIPPKYRKEIIDRKINLYILNGFEIARNATSREDLQTRMQGNSFLGAFFKVSPFMKTFNIPVDEFNKTVKAQYEKKFGRFGEAVVASNMSVMQAGFDRVRKLDAGDPDAPDLSAFVGEIVSPCQLPDVANADEGKAPMFRMDTFDKEFRAGLGYHQPASPLASVGMVASGTGATAGKYVARREVPVWIEENCTQCMDCITVCPDTALPNTAQEIGTVIETAVKHYVGDPSARAALMKHLPEISEMVRSRMLALATDKEATDKPRFGSAVIESVKTITDPSITHGAISELSAIMDVIPVAYLNVRGIFIGKEKKEPGSGGVFSIFVSDLCKGCGACVVACGSHEALKMSEETEEMHARMKSEEAFLKLLKDTPAKFLGIFDPDQPQDSKAAALKNHLMQHSKYSALVAGDGSCAGCGEKSVLRSVSTVTEALMRPVFHKKANRLREKANNLKKHGTQILGELKLKDGTSYTQLRRSILHLIMGYGAESAEAVDALTKDVKSDDATCIEALAAVLENEAVNCSEIRTVNGKLPNGMSAMAMTANTGCNTVYGSTPPNNPHPYPWMNSLFQDGSTIGWLVGESFIRDHAAHAVIPERLSDFILNNGTNAFSEDDYFLLTHFTDTDMSDRDILELPKVWAIGGDGGMGDIGFQNLSKVVLQNRPNVQMLMLDTQVYSNTGGQNSDSSVMTGGFDMNQAGAASEGKLTEKKSAVDAFLGGHGSPYLAQVSMANSANLYKAIIEGLCYRGTAFIQAYTTCQPEHGVPDHSSQIQAQMARDSRGMPEMIFNPQLGETYAECINIKANPNFNRDWHLKSAPVTKVRYPFTVAHWAFTEARFRLHHKVIDESAASKMIPLLDKLMLMTQDDVVHRRYLDSKHRSYVPDFGVFAVEYTTDGKQRYHSLSRQMVLFCVERRKAWRLWQSRSGIENKDYLEQKELLKKLDSGELTVDEYLNRSKAEKTV